VAGFDPLDLVGRCAYLSGMLGGSLLLAAISVNLVIAWLIVLAGMVHLTAAHRAHRAGGLTWRLMIGFAYVLFGVYLIASPGLGSFLLARRARRRLKTQSGWNQNLVMHQGNASEREEFGNPVKRTDRGRCRISSCVTEAWCD
jgi:hypothetical protein